MNEPAPAASTSPDRHLQHVVGWVIFGFLVCCLAVTSRSYWIDEAESVYKATLPTFAAWWHRIHVESSGNLQLPLYHLFAWAWEKAAGTNELAMRAGNIPWFLLGLTLFAAAMRSDSGSPSGAGAKYYMLVPLLSPFAWYYLNEARPYALQIGLSFLVLGCLVRLAGRLGEPLAAEKGWVLALCAGCVLLATSGLLAMIWLGAYLSAALLDTPRRLLDRLVRTYWKEWGATLLLLFATGLFYLWTLHIGARATAVGTTGFKNLLFIPYELLGFAGLGPGRLNLRAGGGALEVMRPWLLPLGVYGALLLAVLIAAASQMANSLAPRTRYSWAAAFLAAGAFILGVGVTVRFRVLGRHWAPVLPLCLFVLAQGVIGLRRKGGWARGAVLAGFLGLSLVSCLMLRFAERHLKDDYRTAAGLGRDALRRGEKVWWNADAEGALVYNLPVSEQLNVPHTAYAIANPARDFAGEMPQPDLVLTSKPDIYDNAGALRDYLERGGFHPVAAPTAFIAWRRSGK